MNFFPPTPPIYRFAGSKAKKALHDAIILSRELLSLSEGSCFIDPFCGSGAVSLGVGHGFVLMNDFQERVVQLHKSVAYYPKEFLRTFNAMCSEFLEEPTRKSFERFRSNEPKNPIQRAAWYCFVCHAGFNKVWRVNKKGTCNTPFGKEAGIRRIKTGLDEKNMFEVSNFLNRPGVSITHGSFEGVIRKAKEGDVVYCDPPYNGQFTQYTKQGFSWEQQQILAMELKEAWRRGAHVIVHGPCCFDIASLYRGWCKVYITPTRRIVSGGNGQVVGEMIILSQPKQRSLWEEHNSITKFFEDGGYVEFKEESTKEERTQAIWDFNNMKDFEEGLSFEMDLFAL